MPMKVSTQTDESCDESCIANRQPNAEIQTNKQKGQKKENGVQKCKCDRKKTPRETEQFLASVTLPSDDSLPFVTFVLPQKTVKKKTKRLIVKELAILLPFENVLQKIYWVQNIHVSLFNETIVYSLQKQY